MCKKKKEKRVLEVELKGRYKTDETPEELEKEIRKDKDWEIDELKIKEVPEP